MTYEIEIKAVGYETLAKEVEAKSLKDTEFATDKALDEWCQLNDCDEDTKGFAFVSVSRIKSLPSRLK